MTERLRPLAPEELTDVQRTVYEAIANGRRAHQDGPLRGPFNSMLYAPGVGGPLQALGEAIRFGSGLSDRMRELVTLRVAYACDSGYEVRAHAPLATRAGVTDDELRGLGAGQIPAALAPEEAAAIALVDAVLADAHISQEIYDASRELLGEQGLVEITVVVGYYRTLASLLALFEID